MPTDPQLALSVRTTDSRASAGSSNSSMAMNSLHGNLMRRQHGRDPLSIYEIVAVLGEGSMGSVSKVHKRDEAVGGSARAAFVKQHSKHDCCHFNLPLLSMLSFRSVDSKFTPVPSADLTDVSSSCNTTNSSKAISVAPSSQSTTSSSASQNANQRRLLHKGSSLISYGHKELYYALKSINLDRCASPAFMAELKNEVEILKQLDHPNIVRAIETFDFQDRLYIVLELCNGGDLYARDPYSEDAACNIVNNLLNALAYLHSRNVVHRDLKFENIMWVSKAPDSDVKIIDFGLSQKFAANEHLHDAVGTIYTMSPELLGGDYDAKTDIWSIGVIAFMLLSSSMPFYGKDRVHIIKKIIKGHPHFSSRRWKFVSPYAKTFVKSLLQVNPQNRPTAEEALKSAWFKQELPHLDNLEEIDQMDRIQASIESFGEYTMLKKLALMVVAYKSTTEEIGFLRRMFKRFDVHKNGEISLEEFKEALSEVYEYSDEEMERMYRGIDIDGTGLVHYSEFLAATIEAHGSIDEERLAEAFDRLDSDDTGYITVENLADFLGKDVPREYLVKIIDEADIVRDKRVSYAEFLQMWSSEGDVKLKEAKEHVVARRLQHQLSHENSTVASSEDMSSCDMATDLPVLESSQQEQVKYQFEGFGSGGMELFKKQKALSVRGDWV